jgi:hypothetical protein
MCVCVCVCMCLCLQLWPVFHQETLISLILYQVVMMFVTAIKKVIWAPILIALTLVASAVFWSTCSAKFGQPLKMLSYQGATDADHADEVGHLFPFSRGGSAL